MTRQTHTHTLQNVDYLTKLYVTGYTKIAWMRDVRLLVPYWRQIIVCADSNLIKNTVTGECANGSLYCSQIRADFTSRLVIDMCVLRRRGRQVRRDYLCWNWQIRWWVIYGLGWSLFKRPHGTARHGCRDSYSCTSWLQGHLQMYVIEMRFLIPLWDHLLVQLETISF